MSKQAVICLMGPTASGKTNLAVELVSSLPFDIISVDSAMIYKGMNIGTAKPNQEILKIAPHRLIDIVDPAISYSAGQFRSDALYEIEKIVSHRRVPLLVGGTMLYFRVLQQGIATLPNADSSLRQELTESAKKHGWPFLHDMLEKIDKMAASRIHPNDSQRIQRALEVYLLTGRTISQCQQEKIKPLDQYEFYFIGLIPEREKLNQIIKDRFNTMLKSGLIDEVTSLFERGDLTLNQPSIRSVGYYEVWQYLLSRYSYDEMREKAIIATRQLAKRQFTWLRSWPDLKIVNVGSAQEITQLKNWLMRLFSDKFRS